MKGSSNKDSNKMFGEVCFGSGGSGTWNVEFDITALFCSSVHALSYLHVNVNCPFLSLCVVREGIFLFVSHTSERCKMNKIPNTFLYISHRESIIRSIVEYIV